LTEREGSILIRLAQPQRGGSATGVILISTGLAPIGPRMVLIISGVIGLMLENSQRSYNCSSTCYAIRHRDSPICSLGRAEIWLELYSQCVWLEKG